VTQEATPALLSQGPGRRFGVDAHAVAD